LNHSSYPSVGSDAAFSVVADNIASHLKRLAAAAESCTESPIEPQLVRRSSVSRFDFKTQCFICGNEITEKFLELESKKPFKARNVVYKVRDITGSFRSNVLKTAEERNDELGKAVALRIQPVDDLVAYEAQYHLYCYKNFCSGFAKTPLPASIKRGPFAKEIDEAMDSIYNCLENNSDECQFSLDELINQIQGDFIPDKKTVKTHLQKRYGDNVIMYVHQKQKTIVCLKDIGEKVLKDSWYQNKCANEQEENLRVVEAAAKIIRADIRAQVYEVGQYPPPDHFMEGAEDVVPPTLKHFMETLIVQQKKGDSVQSWKTRCTAFAHCIISAVRPRSFLSNVKIGLAAFIYKKFASRKLLDILHSLGFSSSYHEAVRFEVSSSLAPPIPIEQNGFMQFVFDNADFNTQTVDGYNTFHVMGGIYTVAPSSVVKSDIPITRLNAIPVSEAVGKFGHVALQPFMAREGDDGLKEVTIQDLSHIFHTSDTVSPSAADVLWLFSKYRDLCLAPGWNVFMEQLTADYTFDTTFTACLPFINAPPSDYDTIYTALVGAAEKSAAAGQQVCLVTFDQPLYMKARYIIANTTDDRLKNVIPRLGGFHLLMSFLGAIGFIMDGSGLKELFNVIFAMNSIDKIMGGHAYYRALRGHILSHAALMKIILKMMDLTDVEEQLVEVVYAFDKPMILAADPPECRGIRDLLNLQITDLKKRGPTAQLWVQYLQMVNLVKQFILSERMGKWELHLETVWKMLPYFHASGHFAYAKCAHLYLQDMTKLKTVMPMDEYNKFATEGFFTVRRLPTKFWSGTWTDMLIEQFLMKNMKTSGGLTNGRGVTEAIQTRWTMAMTSGQHVCEAMENFCNVSCNGSSEQHHSLTDACTLRDNKDMAKLYEWLKQHTPFPQHPDLFSIATGVVGDEKIDCHKAWEVGMKGVLEICGQDFGTVKFKRSQRVKSLALMNSGIPVGDNVVPINPTTLFQRITVAKHSEKELEEFLSYDLAPYSLTLFDHLHPKREGLRKTAKSTLYKAFTPLPSTQLSGQVKYVIDGGHLLHRVPWTTGTSFSNICDSYITYIKKHYGPQPVVVFDGYPPLSASGTKTAERMKRSRKTSSVDILIDDRLVPTMSKASFLSNSNNKKRLIAMLGDKLSAQHLQWQQAEEDADTKIVEAALALADCNEKVVIVGEDVDLLVILIGRSKAENVYFMKPGKDKESTSIFSPATAVGNLVAENILFLHAISGCDTTSSFFNLGKMRFVKTLKKHPKLKEAIEVYKDPEASRSMLKAAGDKFMVEVYGYTGKTPPTLNQLRYFNYKRMAFKRSSNLATLPPSAAALHQHCYRTYHQVQQWLGFKKDPEDWGWRKTSCGLQPVTTAMPPAPPELLKLITCSCKTNCTRNCGCKKTGLFCSVLCSNCQGTCENILQESGDGEDPEVEQEALAFGDDSTIFPACIASQESGPSKKRRVTRTGSQEYTGSFLPLISNLVYIYYLYLYFCVQLSSGFGNT